MAASVHDAALALTRLGLGARPGEIARVAPDPRGIAVRMGEVLFDFDSAALRADTKKMLDVVIDTLKKKYPDREIIVEGHTDSNASDSYNLKLSQRRVDAVKQILIGKFGIESSRLNAISYGESRPIATNATAEGRQQNRRVVAVFQAN